MIKVILLIVIVAFFGMNMGGSGIAPSFAVSYCSKIISKNRAVLLFGLFLTIGAVLLGQNVAETLGKGIVPKETFSLDMVLIVFFSASLGLFTANLLKTPQSTSWATVFSILGSGIALNQVNYKKFFLIIPFWVLLPVVSYFLTLVIYKRIYPPRFKNLWIYEKIFANEQKIKKVSLLVSCYVAFAIGTNNVANAVGPLAAGNIVKNTTLGFFFISIIFIFGAMFWGKNNMCTVGKGIVPLGAMTATIVNLITATLLICASFAGVPQSLVQLNTASIFAISHSKKGFYDTVRHGTTKKTFFVWLISPIIAFISSFILAEAFIK